MTMTAAVTGPHGVIEPWQPQVGDWVIVTRAPECQAGHSFEPYGTVAYGRVESIDRTMDDPEIWRQAYATDDEDGDPDTDARDHRGHWYLVQDVLDTHRVTVLDGFYCAFELTNTDEATALGAIDAARTALASVPRPERLLRALFGEAKF